MYAAAYNQIVTKDVAKREIFANRIFITTDYVKSNYKVIEIIFIIIMSFGKLVVSSRFQYSNIIQSLNA